MTQRDTNNTQDNLLAPIDAEDLSEQGNTDVHGNIGPTGDYGTPNSESATTNQDPYANLGQEQLYSTEVRDPYQGDQDLFDDIALYNDQDPQNTENNQQANADYDQTDLNEPDTADPSDQTAGGEGLYGSIEDLSSNNQNLSVQPGSDRDEYGTKGSQDQYGYQQ